MMNMQIEINRPGFEILGFNQAYKNILDKETRALNKMQRKLKKILEEKEKITQQVSLLSLQIEAQAKLLRDL